jgi:transcriptional regulator with XRE-family HTH domain
MIGVPLKRAGDAGTTVRELTDMAFHERVVALRKNLGLTQQALSDLTGIHISQIRRYEGNTSQPSLDALKKIAVALSTTTDFLLFEKDERGPEDDLRFQFEAAQRLNPEEKRALKMLIEGILLQHQASQSNQRLAPAS